MQQAIRPVYLIAAIIGLFQNLLFLSIRNIGNMKKLVVAILLFCVYTNLTAQKEYPLTASIKNAMTPEQVLGLSSSYSVIQCRLYHNHKNGDILLVCYSKDGTNCCCIVGCSDFNADWSHITNHLEKGDRIILDDILVRKGGKDYKWVGKVFVVQ